MLDWIFEGIVGWVSSITATLMDAVSGLFLEALGTDMTAMEEYFPFVTRAYGVMQVMAYAILILIVVWQLFRAFGGPITEAENPWHLVVRGGLFSFLVGYAKPIFTFCLDIARAPYTSLMDITMTGEDFTFAGVEQALTNGLATIVSAASVVGLILILILLIALGWNYFKLLLETVERYVVIGVLCYTSPLAFSMGASKSTSNVFRSWCRMVGSQLLLLVMNVWFLRGFASSMGQFIGGGGALSSGKGSIFLWMFCALAYLKCAQRFDSYLSSMGLSVAQTGSSMGMEMLMAARVITGAGSGARSAGSVFGHAGGSATATGTGAAATGFAAGFASRFNPNSYVRDAVVDGGTRTGFSGGAGFVGRVFGGMAARNGATLNSQSISSVASRAPGASGTIAGDIADRSLSNYLPHMNGFQLNGTQITGGHISTTATTPDGKKANVDLYSASQYEKPDTPHSVVTAADGSQWYQVASGEGRGVFYDAPVFGGMNAQSSAGGVPTDPPPTVTDDAGAESVNPGVQPDSTFAETGDVHASAPDGVPQGVGTFPEDQMLEASEFTPEGVEPGGHDENMITFPGGNGDVSDPAEVPALEYSDAFSAEPPDGANIIQFPGVSAELSETGGPSDPEGGIHSNMSAFPNDASNASAPEEITPAAFEGSDESLQQMPGFVGDNADQFVDRNSNGYSESFDPEYEGGSFHGGPSHADHSASDEDTQRYYGGSSYGGYAEAPLIAATFPGAQDGTILRTVGDGVIEASSPDGGNTLWYNSAYYQEPDAPHSVMEASNGVQWYAMQQQAQAPQFEAGAEAAQYNQAVFRSFMPGYDGEVTKVDGSHSQDGHFEVRHADGSGTVFYDTARYATPRGDYQVMEDSRGSQWYAIRGEAAVDRKPVYENGQPVYDEGKLRTVSVETVRYRQTPSRFVEPQKRADIDRKPPRKRQ